MTHETIVITGANGFIGKNAVVRLAELSGIEPRPVTRNSTAAEIEHALTDAAAVIHLAGVNRPQRPAEFTEGNHDTTKAIVAAVEKLGRRIPIVYASSVKAIQSDPYGESKKAAEDVLFAFAQKTANPVYIFRLPNVFGKWCRPNYNSAVATFCHNIARGLPITINDGGASLELVYVDDVIDSFVELLKNKPNASGFYEASPVYHTTVGDVAKLIQTFRSDRKENLIEAVGAGLKRALYATYVASLPIEDFAYPVVSHSDPRGVFSEVLKTRASGQFSYFTALPGVTRGGHYHHTKTEKFLIVHGEALFRFRHIVTGETHEIKTSSAKPTVVETVPGWAHDVTNVGADTLISLLWANEIFDRERPDTFATKV
jgi:UDP-2-acetamido-2,6-beta-L-arabino-hexul-4-ose reductase